MHGQGLRKDGLDAGLSLFSSLRATRADVVLVRLGGEVSGSAEHQGQRERGEAEAHAHEAGPAHAQSGVGGQS